MAKTWVLTGSLPNFIATREHGFRIIGAKERRRRLAEQIEPGFVPAEELVDQLEHARKWPREHWQLAFQGQLRTVSDADAALLERSICAAARGATASASA